MSHHYVLDSFGESGVIAVSEDRVVPSSADCESVEFDVIFDDMLIVVHSKVINTIFGVGSRIDWTKLNTECFGEACPPLIPFRRVGGVKIQ